MPPVEEEEVGVATTVLVASGNGVAIDASGTELAQVDVAQYRTVRITAANWAFSPTSIRVSIVHVTNPGTPEAGAIDGLDSYILGPDENTSKSYDVPGDTILMSARSTSDSAGCRVFFTIYGRPD